MIEKASRPPVSQHLCLFFKAEIDEEFSRILIELNKAEVQKLIWVPLAGLADTFNKKYSNSSGAFEYDPAIMLHQ